MDPFQPLLRNPHLLTIAGNFAVRRLDAKRFPIESKVYTTEPDVRVLVHTQRPATEARGEIVMIHGLEGSSDAGYMRSMSQLALENGYAVHRTNMRSCGGTEALAKSMYHAGMTGDTLSVLRQIRAERTAPIFLFGYSLGGNVALKLTGELGDDAQGLLKGVCAVSTPLDLAACVRQTGERENWIYSRRFLSRLKERIRKRADSLAGICDVEAVQRCRTVYEFDDLVTAKFFGFGPADNYYATQSCNQFLHRIRVPTLLVQAKDDPLIPFDVFSHPAIANNPFIELYAVDHGGHLGFVASAEPRFWVDRILLKWIQEAGNK